MPCLVLRLEVIYIIEVYEMHLEPISEPRFRRRESSGERGQLLQERVRSNSQRSVEMTGLSGHPQVPSHFDNLFLYRIRTTMHECASPTLECAEYWKNFPPLKLKPFPVSSSGIGTTCPKHSPDAGHFGMDGSSCLPKTGFKPRGAKRGVKARDPQPATPQLTTKRKLSILKSN